MEELIIANKNLKTAHVSNERDYKAQITKLDRKESSLKERLNQLNKKKIETSQSNGDVDATDDDLLEVNAGGIIVVAKRSTLTQLKGTRLEALFSGRWDKKLQQDGNGRIFLDVNPVVFRALVDYLNDMAISSEDDPPSPPSVDDEHKHILQHQLGLFGLLDRSLTVETPDSNIVKTVGHMTQLHNWLEEDGSDGELSLLYRSSRDGAGAAAFHSKCDNKGCTLTVIETTDGFVLGGYSNTPWSSDNAWHAANKAFLFVLSGSDIASPCKMNLKNANDGTAVGHLARHGPVLGRGGSGGYDLIVNGSKPLVSLKFGNIYEPGPSQLDNNGSYKVVAIKEMEVFQVSGTSSWPSIATSEENKIHPKTTQVELVTRFSEDINKAIDAKQKSLLQAELEIFHLEYSFKDEHNFIATFATGDANDVVTLNVSGIVMATKRSTLQTAEESVLAQQFDDAKWTEQGCNTPRLKEWSPDDVSAWVQKLHGIPDDVVGIFKENEITGHELLHLKKEGLKMMGIERTGTVCVLLGEIKKLEKASHDFVTLIEHSPFCFGKILDYLRLKQLCSQGLAEEPDLPTVCESQKSRYEKVVKYYFPGDSAKFILG